MICLELVPITDHVERAGPEKASGILAGGLVVYVGFTKDGSPHVIPMNYQYHVTEPAALYLHGAGHSWLIGAIASGIPLCVAVIILDGLVYSKNGYFHTVNYRSAVCYGRGSLLENVAVKANILAAIISRYFYSREANKDYAPPRSSRL